MGPRVKRTLSANPDTASRALRCYIVVDSVGRLSGRPRTVDPCPSIILYLRGYGEFRHGRRRSLNSSARTASG